MTDHIAPVPAFKQGVRDTLVHMLARAVENHGEKEFVVIDGEPITYADLDRQSNALAREFARLGVKKGDRVVSLFNTSMDVFRVWFALNKVGAVWVPINTAYRGEFLRHQISDAGARLAICDHGYLERFVQIAGQLPDLSLILVRGQDEVPPCPITIERLDDYRGTDDTPLPIVADPADLCALLYTSGTTGPSKGCMISHNYMCAIARINQAYTWQEEGETLWTPLPIFHAAALGQAMAAMSRGLRIAIASQFSVSSFWDDLEAANASSALLMATIFPLIAHAPDTGASKRYFGKLRMIFGVPITPEVRKIWKERFGVQVASSWSYGQTESIRLCGVPHDETPPELCAGRPVELYDVVILDENDQPVPPGTVGQICHRPREANVMFEGYWGRPDSTNAVWKNMWMHTGDLGKMDEQGYLYFADRAKDYLRHRGENVSSFEVEAAFMQHHSIAEVAIHAIGAQTGDDDIKLTAVLREGAHGDHKALCLWAVENLPHFAVPRYYEFRAALPKNPTGRVLKYQLRDEGVTADTWDREEHGIQVRRQKVKS